MEELVRRPWRLGRVGRVLVDLTVAGTAFVIIAFYLSGAVSGEWSVIGTKSRLTAALVVLVVAAQLVPLLWRRRHPLIGFTIVSLAHAAQVILIDNPLGSQIGFPVAVYAVARYASARWGLAALAVGLFGAGLAVYDWVVTFNYSPEVAASVDPPDFGAYLSMGLAVASFPVAGWALGALARTRAAYVDSLIERNEQLHREAEQRAALGATQERARIAREMHDVVAHGLSVIVVQADGARYAAVQDPSLAPAALETVAQTAREALAEMRQLLGLLRDGDALTRPQPRLGDIATLVEEAQAGGAAVTATLPGLEAVVPEGVALTAFRVVQESLSNVRKHAGPGAAATVTVTADGDTLAVEVVDDGRGAAADPTEDSGGLGLVGMRERIAAHDGTLEAGPASGGGFRVYATLPLVGLAQ
ncbi:signal transduction histidine kinase [Nocardioides albertanoniae]|uniref:histidine kinase n=1 Tax=Nocardioides albertanoniae TaxID=1175486 RepID=A0A543A5N2_9ACTN|nr:sensor histidine kinase [Nocardioides albertanoniae]TQL67874.1 signal transduction histidine kinase [Nocardioides albertanoniae]